MYSFPNFQPVHCSISGSNCCFLTWIQVSQGAGKVVWYSCLLKNFPICCDPHSQRLWHSQWSKIRYSYGTLFFFSYDPTDPSNLISGSSAFSKSSVNIWKFSVHVLFRISLPPHAKSWLIGKDSDAGRDWGQEEKGMTEDEMAGWHHSLDGRESEWTLGVGDGQGGLACCDSWGRKESNTTQLLNWTELENFKL